MMGVGLATVETSLPMLQLKLVMSSANDMLHAWEQVVGRVHAGQEVLEQLNGATTADEQPQPAVVLAACGLTNARVRPLFASTAPASPQCCSSRLAAFMQQ